MSAVELRGIGKSFAGQTILRGVDLTIESGQYVVLLGPSGCGKTTTLRLIAGLDRPDAGDIRIDGRDLKETPPSRRDVAMVFQGDALYPHLTIRQSIAYGLRGRATKAELLRRIDDAAGMVAIEPLLDRLPSGLSGGELRRASVAKAIARRASVRLLDEPLSAVDASAVHTIQDDLLRWHGCYPGTTLHVTHDGNEAMRMADRIAVMDSGRIVQFDTPSEVYRRPATIDVAAAVGWPPMGFVSGKLSGGCLVVAQNQNQNQTLTLQGFDGSDREVVIGVRPDDWRAADDAAPAESTSFVVETRLTKLRQIDHRWMASLLYADTQITAMFHSSDGLQLGQVHCIAASVEDLHIFDAADGKRLTE